MHASLGLRSALNRITHKKTTALGRRLVVQDCCRFLVVLLFRLLWNGLLLGYLFLCRHLRERLLLSRTFLSRLLLGHLWLRNFFALSCHLFGRLLVGRLHFEGLLFGLHLLSSG